MRMRPSSAAARLALLVVLFLTFLAPLSTQAQTVVTVTQISYDALGRLQCTAVRMNPSTFSSLPASACAQGTAGSQGPDKISQNVYDASGQVVQVLHGVGTSLQEAYATYAFSGNGKQTDVVDANGNHAQFSYDGFDRQSQWTFPSTTRASAFTPSLSVVATIPATQTYYCPPNNPDSPFYGPGERYTLSGTNCNTEVFAIISSTSLYYQFVSNLACQQYSGDLVQDSFYPTVYWCGMVGTSPALSKYNCPPGYSLSGTNCNQTSALATANAPNTNDYEAYSYDANGNRTTLRKRDASVLTYQYDALNRASAKVVPQRTGLPATDARSVYYSYDLLGRQLTAWFDSSTSGQGITNAYDTMGRLSSTSQMLDGTTRKVSYCYDADGNRTLMSYPDSAVGVCPTGGASPTGWTNYVRYAYDGLNRPTTITTSAGTTPASYTYNPDGTRAGYASNSTAVSTSYSYDSIDRLSGLTNAPTNTSYKDIFGFTYNSASQITQLTKSNNVFAFTGLNAGTTAYSANGLNQYASVKGVGYTYDANGNLIADGAGTTYLYDVENRMVTASNATNPSLAAATMRYDPLGRLYEVVSTVSGGGATRFVYGGDELLAEYDGGGNLLRRYVHGADLKSDDPAVWYEGATLSSTSERLLRPNWQGSIELVTDTTGASVYGANTYDEFGNPGPSNGGNGNVGRFQYTGQAWISEARLYYYKARMYSPILGRFMQTDPIGYGDDVDLYAYVGNSPVDRVDYSGRDAAIVVTAHKLTINLPVEFYGKAATKENKNIVISAIKSFWSTKYKDLNVDVNVIVNPFNGILAGILSGDNLIDIEGGSETPTTSFDRYVNLYTGNPVGLGWSAAHEAGHLMHLLDKYREGARPDGSRITVPFYGWGNNIMGAPSQPADGRNIAEIIRYNPIH